METAALLSKAISHVGLAKLAVALGVSYQAVRKWQKAGRMPRTEWTGESRYAEIIEELTGGHVTKSALLSSSTVGAAQDEFMPCRDKAA